MEQESCSICLDLIRQSQDPIPNDLLKLTKRSVSQICILPLCGHVYHSCCLLRHAAKGITQFGACLSKCPLCRKEIVIENIVFLPDSLFSLAPVLQVPVPTTTTFVSQVSQNETIAKLLKD
jgi:hypothetical protein